MTLTHHPLFAQRIAEGVQCIAIQEDTLSGLKSGAIFGTVVQQPYQFGYASVKLLSQPAKGDKSGLPKGGLEIIPTEAVTPKTVDAYVAEQNTLLGKS